MATLTVGPGKTYATITLALAAIPNALADIYDVVVDAGVYSEAIDFQVRTGTDANHYIHVRAAAGSEHKFNLGAGVRIDSAGITTVQTVNARSPFNRLSNVIAICNNGITFGAVVQTGADAQLLNVVAITPGGGAVPGIAAGARSRFINCFALCRGTTNGSFAFVAATDSIWYGCGTVGWSGAGLVANGATNVLARNTFVNTRVGAGAVDFWAIGGGSFAAGSSNNLSSDASAPGGSPQINKNLASLAFVNSGADNYHIRKTSAAYNVGANLGSVFSKDIDLQTIMNWSIGPDDPTGINYALGQLWPGVMP